jgi:hypothetical protein
MFGVSGMSHDEDFETPKGTIRVEGKPGEFRMHHAGSPPVPIPARYFGHAVAAAHAAVGLPPPDEHAHWLERHDGVPADWTGDRGYKLRPGEKGMSPAWVLGNRFIKRVYAPEYHVEPAASNALTALRAPHIPVRYAFRDGMHLVHSEYDPKLKTLNEITPAEVEKLNPAKAQHLLLSEWVAAVGDRHGGNYTADGRALDLGEAFGHNSHNFSHTDVTRSALWQLLRRHKGLDLTAPVPPASVAHAHRVGDEVVQHAKLGNGDDAGRDAAERLKVLVPGVRWGDLADWTDKMSGGEHAPAPTASQVIAKMFGTR